MAAFTQEFDYDANQLLFNLDVPNRTRNMAFRMGKPDPVIIEKFGPNSAPAPMSPMRVGNKGMYYNLPPECYISPSKKSLQFSAISEDSLNMAVKLAKRDLEKQKEEETVRKTLSKTNNKNKVRSNTRLYGRARSPGSPISRSRSTLSPSRTKIVQSKGYKDKLKKRADRNKNKPIPIREHDRGREVEHTSSQTRRRDVTPPGAVIRNDPSLANMPVTTNSPPTRDSTVNTTKGPPLSGDEKIMHEIKRLRDEMEKCMKQIKEIEERSRAAPVQPKSNYAEDIEREKKRKIRAEEQTTRSSRNIYMLAQQVKDIQNEINKMNAMKGEGIKYNRKSQTLSKLAAAHRGAVRVLQNFVTHLPDYDLKQGVPRNYQELGQLLRQLAICCAQLEVVGQTGVPDSVLYLLRDMADLNKVIDQSMTPSKSPSRTRRAENAKQQQQQQRPKSPPHAPVHRPRSPVYDEPLDSAYFESPRRKEVGFQEEPEWKSASNSAFSVERMDEPAPIMTDRERALKAGIRSLMEAASNPTTPRTPRLCSHQTTGARKRSPVPPLNLPRTPRTDRTNGLTSAESRGSRHRSRSPAEVLRQSNEKIKKGLLIPSKLQSAREKTSKHIIDLGEAHYAEPTYSSRSKEVLPNEYNRPQSPVNPRRSGSPMTPRRVRDKTDIARQVWEDREYSRREMVRADHDIKDRQKIEDLSVRLGRSGEWVTRQEKRIRDKLQPLLSQAEVELNADLLADMILSDMVKDTARELQHQQYERDVTHDAHVMSDVPSMDNMLQRLKLMEDEQNEIRTRWATINYEDHYEQTARKHVSQAPKSPEPIVLTRNQERKVDHVTSLVDTRFNTEESSDGAIMFTKSKKSVRSHDNLSSHRSDVRQSETDYDTILGNIMHKDNKKPPIRISLTEEIIDNIHGNKRRYTEFLTKMNYQEVGRFNPWNIMEEIADEVLADCFDDISKELWEINNEIVEHTYKQEFKSGGIRHSPNNSTLNDTHQ